MKATKQRKEVKKMTAKQIREPKQLPEFMSPYALAKHAGIKHAQMLYNYINWNKLTATRNSTGKWQIARKDAEEFLAKYAPRVK